MILTKSKIITVANKLYMAGGGFSGLTSQTLRPLSCGSDTISLRNPPRQHVPTVTANIKRKPKILNNDS